MKFMTTQIPSTFTIINDWLNSNKILNKHFNVYQRIYGNVFISSAFVNPSRNNNNMFDIGSKCHGIYYLPDQRFKFNQIVEIIAKPDGLSELYNVLCDIHNNGEQNCRIDIE